MFRRGSSRLSAVRRYLRSLAGLAAEGAASPDPRVTLLALQILERETPKTIRRLRMC